MAEIKTERLDSYRRLIDISRDLASTLDLDILLSRIVHAAAEISGSEAASILLYDDASRQLYFQVSTNMDESTRRGITVPLDGSIAGPAAKLLFHQLDLRGGQFVLLVHLLHGARGGHFLGPMANVFVERLGRVVGGQVIVHLLALLVLHLDDGLALVGFLQRALGARGFTGDGLFLVLVRRE